MEVKYEVVIKNKTKGPKADLVKGDFNVFFDNMLVYTTPFMSGGWGNGPVPIGEWEASGFRELSRTPDNSAYTLEGRAWFYPMTPKFKTSRTGIGIHPDGNVPGSLGCVVLQSKTVQAFYLFSFISLLTKKVKMTVKEA